MRRAAAVIIGVDRTGGLDPLKSAARGAREVADWLRSEHFDVECLTDGPGQPVTVQQVSAAITKFATTPPTYEILVVYFSGHGQWHARADHWLLSGAPQNTAEAINLEGAMYTARRCGIPNVVFISDACRTNTTGASDSLVAGVDAFPNNGIQSISKIDYFKATSEARPAYEIPIGGSEQSVLTRAILSSFENPEPHIVKQIVNGSETVTVVPNRLLEAVLQARVDALLDGIDGNPVQNLETNVPSSDDVYIARVRTSPSPALQPSAVPPPFPTAPSRVGTEAGTTGATEATRAARRRPARAVPGRAAAEAIRDTLRDGDAGMMPAGVDRDEIDARTPDPAADHFETQTGFVVRGARVAHAEVSPASGSHVDVLNDGNDPRGDAVRVYPNAPALSVLVILKDGRSVVMAALQGYLGHLQFDEGGLANVSYVPSSNSPRWSSYEARRGKLDRLRALVALAVDRNTFRVRSEREAAVLADRIRVDKALDPTLGIYAAYAFAQAGLDSQVRDLLEYMRGDLEADLFDVAMLSGGASSQRARNGLLVPFCPMLTQGWHLLKAYDARLPDALEGASRFLRNSLWTTFTERGTALLHDAINSGELR